MPVITLSRQYGSLGNDIAESLAARLGCRLVMRDLVNQAALRAGAPSVALAVIDELNLLGISPSPAEFQAYTIAVRAVMEELAAAGDVIIVGRAGQVTLADYPGVFHLRIVAPFSLRSHRIAARHNIALKAAEAQVRASDRARKTFLKRFYNADLNNPLHYDLVLNTARISLAVVCDIVCQAVQGLDG